ncbi:hypothetical protein L5515_005209 [Caenorhabditis briggsae]|uniref:FLYWCH-type domain-containing protein n=1 Tax=Caenorhabditis briggsae TaxID=6238 RepID=A0AAE9EJN4_CAEBR|nr:hypothetical protein L5515_005209 [Caenorhabditis briggsae]
MAPRRNKPIIKLEGFAMRFKKMKKGGKELWYCVERERSAKCDAVYSYDPAANTFTVEKDHVRHDEDSVRSDVRISLENLMEAFKHRYKSNFSDVSSASGFEGNVLMSDLLMKVKEEEEHTRMDAEELRLDPNFQVNRSRRLSNVMKDKRLIKVLENSPLPPNAPLTGIQLLDSISMANSS